MNYNKEILDVTCGGRMMWFNKKHPNAIYTDKRHSSFELCDGRFFEVCPDCMADFKELPFEDCSFSLVVFDPPHLEKLGKNSWLAKKYGRLSPGWESEIKGGFDECMRVLKTNGTLIFKWSNTDIPVRKVIDLFGCEPLFGHPTGRSGKTIWCGFLKLEE